MRAASRTRKDPDIGGFEARPAKVGDLQDRRDRDLLGRIAAGSEEAFAEIYRRYASLAAGIAHRVLGDAALGEEVVQEVLVSVWRRAGAYDPARGSVRSWILAQAHHRAVDAVRREEAERRRLTRHATPEVEDPIEDVVEERWMETRRGQVRAALETLSPEKRDVIEMAYYRGMTQTQVARAMGIPLGTVKSRTLAAMRSLRPILLGRNE